MKKLSVNRSIELFLHEIIYLKSEGNYTLIHSANGEKLIVSRTLRVIAEKIDDQSFVRINNSHVINLSFIVSCKKEGRRLIISFDDDLTFDVSRRRIGSFRKELNKYPQKFLWMKTKVAKEKKSKSAPLTI